MLEALYWRCHGRHERRIVGGDVVVGDVVVGGDAISEEERGDKY